MFSTLTSGTFNYGAGVSGTVQDLRNGIFAAVWVCEQSERAADSPLRACLGHGVEGAHVELTPPAGVRLYLNAGGVPRTELDVPSITTSSVVTFYNIPPGEYTARVLPPDGAAGIDCSASQLGTDNSLAWPIPGVPNEFTMRVEPGAIHGSYVFCTVQR